MYRAFALLILIVGITAGVRAESRPSEKHTVVVEEPLLPDNYVDWPVLYETTCGKLHLTIRNMDTVDGSQRIGIYEYNKQNVAYDIWLSGMHTESLTTAYGLVKGAWQMIATTGNAVTAEAEQLIVTALSGPGGRAARGAYDTCLQRERAWLFRNLIILNKMGEVK